jgi:hypothetical protein
MRDPYLGFNVLMAAIIVALLIWLLGAWLMWAGN